jgi:MOSC domain-containing protein YiiM
MGILLGIARAPASRAALIEMEEAQVGAAEGIQGDARGRNPGRQVTVLFREGWEGACDELGVTLSWVTRRANLLVEGIAPPRAGGQLKIGDLLLEVTQETKPCHLMETAHPGLKRALTPEWRGGVCCRVLNGGKIRVGDRVETS